MVYTSYLSHLPDNQEDTMTEYNPFTRGSLPVGTRRYIWTDTARDHTMPVDVWYPATKAHRGQDIDPATMDTYEMVPGMGKTSQHAVKDAEALSGKYPLVVLSLIHISEPTRPY